MKSKIFTTLTILLPALLCVAHVNTVWAKSKDERTKSCIDDSITILKNAIDNLEDDIDSIQNYLNNYPWKGVIPEQATSEAAILKNLCLNGYSKAVAVKPGERIQGAVKCILDKDRCPYLGMYRVVLGIKEEGAQTTIGKELGLAPGENDETFNLIAPKDTGIYQIRFRLVHKILPGAALDAWTDDEGNEPDETTTIGFIIVKD